MKFKKKKSLNIRELFIPAS